MKKKILLVDDDKFIRNTFKNRLKHNRYEVFSSTGGAEAIEKIYTDNFDVVISDIGMPKVNGVEVLKFTKKNKPKTKVIMMSSYVTRKVIEELRKLGADQYIEKSSFLKDITGILDKII